MKQPLHVILTAACAVLLIPIALDAYSDLRRRSALDQRVSAKLMQAQKDFNASRYALAEVSYASAARLDPLNRTAERGEIGRAHV